MIAFDTDVLTDVLLGRSELAERVLEIPPTEQTIPVVVVEEVVRGRLNTIRQAEAGRSRVSIQRAYELFEETFRDLRRTRVLPYTAEADSIYRGWREQSVRVGTHDLRIAAICVAHGATLISRNRRDFERVPGLMVEYWN